MSGNSIGQQFVVTTFGESHGRALGGVVDGCPPGLALTEEDIQLDLDRRRPGRSRYTTQRREADKVQILSGVFEGQTTGTPIGLLIHNQDQRSKDYSEIKDLFRPGHADFTYYHKYGIRDYRGGGRSSARETAIRVAAGAIAKKYLSQNFGINICSFLSQMGPIKLDCLDLAAVDANDFFSADPSKIKDLEQLLDKVRRQGDSIGAKVTVQACNVPIGLGEPVFDKLDADIAHALMSINAVRGVELGDGFQVVEQYGSEHRDEITPKGFVSNHSGGTLGGISTGQTIIAHLALKPTSSITTPGQTVTVKGESAKVSTKGRHDPCVGIRAVPIAEAMLALVLMDHVMRHRAQSGR